MKGSQKKATREHCFGYQSRVAFPKAMPHHSPWKSIGYTTSKTLAYSLVSLLGCVVVQGKNNTLDLNLHST